MEDMGKSHSYLDFDILDQVGLLVNFCVCVCMFVFVFFLFFFSFPIFWKCTKNNVTFLNKNVSEEYDYYFISNTIEIPFYYL